MNVLEAINDRYSCRSFKSTSVSKETILKIMEAVKRTPILGQHKPKS